MPLRRARLAGLHRFYRSPRWHRWPRWPALLAPVLVTVLAALAGRALAAGPGGGSGSSGGGEPNTAPPPESDIDPPSGKVRPAAPDERTGHFLFGVGVSGSGPAGLMGPNTPSYNLAGWGYTLGGFLGVGIGRYGTVQALGDFTRFAAPTTCNIACSAQSFSVGLGVTYHLAQGLAFDPWGSYGMAYRGSSFEVQAPGSGTSLTPQNYQGWDVARIAFGGDFYPTPWFGFGPFIEVDAGANLHRPAPLVALPPDVTEGPRAYAFFQIGVRIAFDPQRRAAPAPQTASAAPRLAPAPTAAASSLPRF